VRGPAAGQRAYIEGEVGVKSLFCGVAVAVCAAGAAHAGSKVVQYAPAPAWIKAAPVPSPAPTAEGAPLRVVYFDSQTRFTGNAQGEESYTAYRMKILKPEALSVGNLTIGWNPSSDDITVHSLKLIRDGQTLDVLATAKFRVIERENQLDQAMLDGDLTATLQVPGLQVGDELEFAATIRHAEAAFGNRFGGALQMPVTSTPGAYRARLTWPSGEKVRWKATPDFGPLAPRTEGDHQVLEVELRDPDSVILTEGAPDRFNLHRNLQASEFAAWGDVGRELWPLFDAAAKLDANSPVRAEAAKIAATTKDPAERAEAALRLVQDRIRYVFVGLDGGGYRPARADETWTRRFGDCKAKTVLLLALLRELGVQGEPVLLNSNGGDLIAESLPTPAVFDHVVVRSRIAGRTYWLDGARSGDRRLSAMPAPASHFALALRPDGADLEPVAAEPPIFPLESSVLLVDASAGFDKPAKVTLEEVMRGAVARPARDQLSLLSKADAERTVRTLFSKENSWIEVDHAGWRYDEVTDALILDISGTTTPEWEGDEKRGRSLDVYHAGQTPPNGLKRPKDEDQAAPWLTEFPSFKRWTTIIHLPTAARGRAWSYRAEPMDTRLGGMTYWREVEFRGDLLRTTMSRRTETPEITAAEAAEIAKQLPVFDNNISQLFEAPMRDAAKPTALKVSQAATADAARLGRGEPIDRADDLAQLDAAIRQTPDARSLFLRRATLLSRLGRADEARADLDEAYRIDPLDPVVLKAKAALTPPTSGAAIASAIR
jgi:hypothetical protein